MTTVGYEAPGRAAAAEAAAARSRLELLLAGPLALATVALAVAHGGAWLVVVPAAAVVLALHAHALARLPRARVGGWLANAVLAGALVVFLGLVAGPELGFYRTATVLSGSMAPTFRPGDAIVVTAEPARDVRVGDVISFHVPTGAHEVETHRVVKILGGGDEPVVETKGDANNTRDPWRARLLGGTVWRYRLRLPMLGYPILWLRSPWLRFAATLVLPALLALWALVRLWTPVQPLRGRHARA